MKTLLLSRSIALSLVAACGLLLVPATTFASRTAPVDGSEPETEVNQTALPRPNPSAATLAEIANQVRTQLTTLEVLMASGQYRNALTQAKALLDDVRLKSGIHPKASYREKINIPAGTLASVLKTANQDFKTLPIDTQDTIALTVSNHRAGFFLDILNLMKRVNLIYLRAFQLTLKDSSGRLLARDVEKIRQDLLDVHAVPLYLKDPKAANYYLIFDFEVANSDQSYLFNRELMDYMLREGAELGIQGEAGFEVQLAKHIAGVRQNFVATLKQPAPDSTGNKYDNPNMRECLRYYSSNAIWPATATNLCLEATKRINFVNNSDFKACFSMTNSSATWPHHAAGHCVNQLAR